MEVPNETENEELRIACLLPSATEICVALGLASRIVGVTHECDIQAIRQAHGTVENGGPYVLTRNGMGENISSQGEIHNAVVQQRKEEETLTCPSGLNSLYPIIPSEWDKARPTLVLTQDLCSVCAPSPVDVQRILKDNATNHRVRVISLQPTSLDEVADTFITVATACGVPDRGEKLRKDFTRGLERLRHTIRANIPPDDPPPRVLLLEWLDPPFDGGHWILQMMEYACVRPALADTKTSIKSQQISWELVVKSDPDVIVVACCGFDLERNVRDALQFRRRFQPLDAAEKVYACDGNKYFASPGPNLVAGTAILAQCAYKNKSNVLGAIQGLSMTPSHSPGWRQVEFPQEDTCDIEDIAAINEDDFLALHKAACERGDLSYLDPETGYHVFTELAHKKRGKCCGSGCRHCPYNHENVVDKTNCIKQPAFLYQSKAELFSLSKHDNVKVLFFSGGKDSFLTIRALVKSCSDCPFGLVLLTTFDSQSRIIAHQETHIDVVVRQAKHLDISLVGVPVHRGTTEPYVDRIRRGLKVIETSLGRSDTLAALVFGDLHLNHIRDWRDRELGRLGHTLEYPLWNAPYSVLIKDFEDSQVPCKLSASTHDGLAVGDMFSREFCEKAVSFGLDGFGENGEFHTVAEVWNTGRELALGM